MTYRVHQSSLDPVASGYAPEQLSALSRRLVDAARAVPGVTGAAASTCGLIAGCSSSAGYRIEGAGEGIRSLYRNWVTPGYFATAGIPLQHGRDFTDRDNAAAPHVAIVNETAAQRYFPGGSPIGKRIWLGQVEIEIVGLVRDIRTQSLHELPVPMGYFPLEQRPPGRNPTLTNMDVRVAAPAVTIEAALRDALQRAEPNLIVGDVGAMSRRLSRDLTRERLVAWLALAFAAMTLLLGAIGLYGVLSYGVARRTQEIGVRMALGARPREMLLMVAGQGARLAMAGLALGVLAAAALSRYLTALLFGVTPLDPAAFAAVTIVFLVITLLASIVPARRATGVDPLVALRCD